MSSEYSENEVRKLDLRILAADLLREMKRFLWLGVAAVILFTAVLGWRSYRSYSPAYRASATFTVYVTNPLQAEVRSYNTATAEQMAKTFPYIFTSSALKNMVMENLGLTAIPSVTASVQENTNIFTLAVTAGDPELAYDVLNAVILYYPEVAEFVVGSTVMNLLDESGVPTTPVNSRDYVTPVKQGALLGIALWLGVSLLFAFTRSTIHNEEELKKLMNLPCIGMFPLVSGYKRKGDGSSLVLTHEENSYGFADSVRLLRIRVEKEMRARKGKVLLVSSAIPGEGKTTVSMNLALSLAMKGKRTALVDCDLRNPSAAQILGKENISGLTEYLTGKVSVKKIIHTLEMPDFYVVFGGKPVSNAAELLAQEQMRNLVEQMRDLFDYVILDTPPSSILSDASEVAELADCALMTIRQNYASRGQILEGVQMITDSGLPLIGCVLNGVESDLLSSSYSYYGYGYGYGYGRKYGRYGNHYGEEEPGE